MTLARKQVSRKICNNTHLFSLRRGGAECTERHGEAGVGKHPPVKLRFLTQSFWGLRHSPGSFMLRKKPICRGLVEFHCSGNLTKESEICSTRQTPWETPTDLQTCSSFFLACSGSTWLRTTAHPGLWSLFRTRVYRPYTSSMSVCCLHRIAELPCFFKEVFFPKQ